MTCLQLGDVAKPGRPAFWGRAVKRQRQVSDATARAIVAVMREPLGLYREGDVGCVIDDIGFRVETSSQQIEFVTNCCHFYLTPALHDGPFVTCSNNFDAVPLFACGR